MSADTTEPGPSSTIGSVNGPADGPTTTAGEPGVEACFDVGYGDGWGLSEWTFSPCLLPTTTSTAVASAGPVAGFGELPVTGGDAGVLVLAAVMVVAGVLLRVRAAR